MISSHHAMFVRMSPARPVTPVSFSSCDWQDLLRDLIVLSIDPVFGLQVIPWIVVGLHRFNRSATIDTACMDIFVENPFALVRSQ
jgi:hypothetical protein